MKINKPLVSYRTCVHCCREYKVLLHRTPKGKQVYRGECTRCGLAEMPFGKLKVVKEIAGWSDE